MSASISTIVRPVAPLLLRTSALLALGAIAGYVSNALRADGVSLTDFDAPASCSGPAVTAPPDAEECDPEPLESVDPGASEPDHAWSVAP